MWSIYPTYPTYGTLTTSGWFEVYTAPSVNPTYEVSDYIELAVVDGYGNDVDIVLQIPLTIE